jgi:diguanylate cyclase (GGDEF)-like protein
MIAPLSSPQEDADPTAALLALLMADGAEAARQARALADDGAAGIALRVPALAALAMVAYREASVDDGDAALDRAITLAGPAPDARLESLLEHARALRERRQGQLGDARARLAQLHARTDTRPAADAYLTAAALGIVESMLGHDDAALDGLYQALHLARRSGHTALVVNALSNLGSFEADLYNLEDALPLLEEAVAGAQQLGHRRLLIFAAGNLVQCLSRRGDAARAWDAARTLLIPVIRPDDPPALQRDDEIAAALLDNGLVDEAAARLARELYNGSLTNELETQRVVLLARVQLARGDAAGALARCRQRQAALEEGGEQVAPAMDRYDLLRTASDAAAACGDSAAAHGLLRAAVVLHEQLLGRAARSRRLSLQITHRLRHAEWERDRAKQLAQALEGLNASLRAEAAENERLRRELLAQALHDPLTGLPNRRSLFDTAPPLLAGLRRRSAPLAAVLLDLDRFKLVNDSHGHDAGDRVLRAFGALLQRELRSSDVVCRYGGEEFVVLMPDAPAEQAALRLERVLATWRTVDFDGAGGNFRCTFSAGVAAWRGVDESLEQLLRRADAALYAAKAAGRAGVHLAPS